MSTNIHDPVPKMASLVRLSPRQLRLLEQHGHYDHWILNIGGQSMEGQFTPYFWTGDIVLFCKFCNEELVTLGDTAGNTLDKFMNPNEESGHG